LFSRASSRMRALSLMKSEYNCSRWKIFLPNKSRRSSCLWMIHVLTLEPNAPTSEPKIAARAVIAAEPISVFLVQHHQNKNHRNINDRSGEQSSRRRIRPAESKACAVIRKDRTEYERSKRIDETGFAVDRRDQANGDESHRK